MQIQHFKSQKKILILYLILKLFYIHTVFLQFMYLFIVIFELFAKANFNETEKHLENFFEHKRDKILISI